MENMRSAATEQHVTVKTRGGGSAKRSVEMIIKMTDRFWRGKLNWAGRRWAGLTARLLLQGKKPPAGGSRSVSDEHVRHRQPRSRVLQPHSSQLRVTISSVVILSSTVLALTSSGILMASFRHGSILSNSWLRRRSAASWFAADRKHMVCVSASATGGKTHKGAGRGWAAAAYRGMLKPSDNDSTELSVGVKVFEPDQKQPPAVVLTGQTKRERGRNYCECKNTDRTVVAALNEAERGPWNLQTPCYSAGWKWK